MSTIIFHVWLCSCAKPSSQKSISLVSLVSNIEYILHKYSQKFDKSLRTFGVQPDARTHRQRRCSAYRFKTSARCAGKNNNVSIKTSDSGAFLKKVLCNLQSCLHSLKPRDSATRVMMAFCNETPQRPPSKSSVFSTNTRNYKAWLKKVFARKYP